MEIARVETLVLSAPKSLPRHMSALRAWQAFAKEVQDRVSLFQCLARFYLYRY